MRTYFIQAEEVEWDFAPSGMNQIAGKALRDTEAFEWTMRYKNRIGSVYKKAQYIGNDIYLVHLMIK
jgi:hephaestin